MADSKISQLTSATTPLAGTEVLPIVQSGATKQVSIDNLTAGRNFSAGTITANIIVPTVAEFPDGTAAAPSITNTGDTDTGMYFPAANAVSLVTAGVNRLRINSAGDVGIGTITPGARLDVRGSATFNEDGANVDFRVEGDTDANLFFVDASADAVGIGTATPTQKLTVAGTITTTQGNTITSNNLAGNAFSLVSNSDATAGSSSSVLLWNNNGLSASSAALSFFSSSSSVPDELRLSNGAAAPITFYTSGSERVRINSSGNVGVGTANPLTILSAYNTTNAFVSSQSTTGYAGLQATNTSGVIYFGIDNSTAGGFSAGNYSRVIWSSGAYPLVLATNGNERMRITDAGNVGIGTTTPASKLDVNGTITATGFSAPTLTVTGNTYLATTSGSVGIGTSSPATKLGVTGNAVFSGGVGGTPFIAFAEDQSGSTPAYWQWNATTGLSTFYTTNASSANGTFNWLTAGAERMRLDSSGNLLVGTTTGVASGTGVAIYSPTASRLQLRNSTTGDTASDGCGLLAFGSDLYVENRENGATLFFNNGSERMRITSAGDVGIGTSTPLQQLHLSSASATGMQITYQGVGASRIGVAAGNLLTFGLDTSNGTTTRMTIDSSGNLGLGVTPSASTLRTLQGPNAEFIVAARYPYVASNATYNSQWFYTNSEAASFYVQATGQHQWFTAPSGTAGNAISFTQAMTLDASGNLGIGTSSPGNKLHIVGSGDILRFTNGSVSLYGYSDSAGLGWFTGAAGTNTGVYYNNTSSYQSFYTGSTERMRLDSAGSLGLGTASPVGKFGVAGSQTVGFNAGLTGSPEAGNLFYTTDGTGWQFRIGKYQSGAFTSQMVFTDAGNIGIGTTSPTAKLDIVGSGATTARLKGGSGTNQGAAFYVEQAGSTNTLFAIGDSAAILGGTPDTAVNIYTAGSVPLTMAVGGTEKVRITSAGDVGIGTASPPQKLTVSGGNLFVSNSTAGSATALVSNSDATAGSNAGLLLWNNNGFSATAGSLYFYSSTSAVPNELRMANGGAAPITFYTNGSERMRLDSAGNLGIGTASASSKLTVDGVTSVGSGNKLSLIGLDINSGGTPTYVKILTTIPTASANADFTVNIKGFIYGAATTTDLSICWHYYNSTFYNATAKSSGGWAPTIRLSSESGYVAIVLSSPGYWPKFYVESMYSSYYNDDYASGWSWVDADATGSPIVTVSYSSNFGNSFVMTTNGNVGIGTSSPAAKLDVVGSLGIRVNEDGAGTKVIQIRSNYAGLGPSVQVSTADPLLFLTNNTERMRITSAGDVGIGTTSPRALLDLNATRQVKVYFGTAGTVGETQETASDYIANNLFVSGESAGTMTYTKTTNDSGNAILQAYSRGITFYSGVTGNTSTTGTLNNFERMRIDSSGNVGIGTSSPAGTLHVYGSGTTQAVLTSGDQTTTYLRFTNTTHNGGYIGYTSDNLIFLTGSSERMRIDSSGNVGIGTSSPAYTLDVRTSASNAIRVGSSSNAFGSLLSWDNPSGESRLMSIGAYSLVFGTNTTERMRLDASGNLGLGVTPSAWGGNYKAFDFLFGSIANTNAGNVDVAVTQNAFFNGSNWITKYTGQSKRYVMSDDGHIWFNGASQTAGNAISFTQAMTLDASGNLGVGTSSPGARLHINSGGVDEVARFEGSGEPFISLYDNGVRDFYLFDSTEIRLWGQANKAMVFATNNTERMRLDSSGNLGLGVTPSAWNSGYKALQIGASGSLASNTGVSNLLSSSNAYFDAGTVYRYIANGFATQYEQYLGKHAWYTAPSGTAGNAIGFTQAMTLDASGSLGVGVTDPDAPVTIQANSGANAIRIRGRATGNLSYLVFRNNANSADLGVIGSGDVGITFDYGGTERARIDSSGNLLVGTTSTSALTAFSGGAGGQVIQSGVPVLALVDSDDTTNGVVWLATSSGVGYLYTKAANPFVFGTNSVEKMRLDASGNLSIGQASSALQSGGTGITLYGSSASEIKFLNSTTGSSATDGTALVASGSDFIINNRESGAVTFGTSNTERARITSSGDLLVGTTTSLGKLTVSGGNVFVGNNTAGGATALVSNSDATAGSNAGVLLWNDNGFSATAGSLYFYSSTSTVANELRLANGGNAPITMYTNGSERVRIKGDGEVQIAGTTDRGAYNLQCNGTGVWGAGAYVNGSDERLKDNIQTLTDGLSIVTQLRPVTYQYKPEYSKDQSIQPGFIAQELQQAMEGKAYVEGVVQAGPEYLNVAYQNLIPILTKAIQELKAEVDALKAQLNRP